jgi:PAS domain S-box-containing protein
VESAGRKLHVLISEDQEDDALLIVDELRQCGYAVTWGRVETSQEMREYLERNQCDLIIADYDLPRFSAMGALQILKESGLDIPFLIVSGAMREIDAVAGMRAGVHDYLSKDNLTRLGVVVERELREATIRAERRQAELLLRRQAQVLDQVHDAVIQMDLQGRILKWNAGATRVFGYSEEEAAGHSIDLIHFDPKSGYDIATILREVDACGRFEGELRSRNKYGEERWTNLSCSLLRDEIGTPYGIVVYGQDTTERREAELALRESEERYRLLMELLPQMIWVARREGEGLRIEFCNQKVLEYFGISMEQIYHGLWRSLVHPDDREQVTEAMRKAFRDNSPFEVQYRLRRAADQSWRWHLARYPPFVGRGEEQRWISAVIDIEDNTRAEEALRKAEKLAAVGRLASSIAHEINNPLEAVTNCLYLLSKSPLDEAGNQYLALAQRELDRVVHITTQTLRFYRQNTKPARTDVHDLLETVLALYEGRMRAFSIEIVRDFSDVPPILAYDGEIRQVLANLVGNALDAMQATGGKLVLRTSRTYDWKSGRTGIAITVSDTGIGMDRATLSRIYEPFFSTKGITGTGLGLWVSREIMEKHQGVVRVRSRQGAGSGTTFRIFLPFEPEIVMQPMTQDLRASA